MRKIGILTYLREYANLGTNMQGYCTQQAVQRAYPGARVELIDYAGWRPVMKPYLSGMSIESLRKDYRRITMYRRFFRDNLVFSGRRLISADRDKALAFIREQRYDAIYVGSDTVLELRRTGKDALTPFWLAPSVPGMKCLIAASAHNLTYESLSDAQRKEIQASLDDFSLLGVRDEATRRVVSHFVSDGDERLQLVPDPTFSYTIDYQSIERYLQRKGIVFDKPVVCLHLLRDSSWGADLATRFRRAGYAIASLRPARYADMIFTDLSPFEQVGLYRYFDLVVTHRFHDSVFSFKNQTPVIAFAEFGTDVTKHGESRIHSLFKSFGMDVPPGLKSGAAPAADYLFSVHRDVIAAFRERRAGIDSVLRENKVQYESFVARSASKLAQ
jgi:polysaccharide pyruvyl transferase